MLKYIQCITLKFFLRMGALSFLRGKLLYLIYQYTLFLGHHGEHQWRFASHKLSSTPHFQVRIDTFIWVK
jgi:hypothetical protein